jgi:hypothetical protein
MSRVFPIGFTRNFNTIHLERTLDEAYYVGLSRKNLKTRNQDQVVSRAYRNTPNVDEARIPILMVPEFWLWRLDNYVISAFASSENTDTDVLFYETGPNTLSPNLHIGQIMARRINDFDAVYKRGAVSFLPTLNIFETSVVSILSEVEEYMKDPDPVKLDINMEANFIHVISDIRSELALIQDILNQQEEVLKDLLEDTKGDYYTSEDSRVYSKFGPSVIEGWTEVRKAKETIIQYRKRTEKNR